MSEFTRMEIKLDWIIYFIDPGLSTELVLQSSDGPCCELNQSWSPAKPKHCRAAPRGCAYVVLRALSGCTHNTFLVNTMKPKSLCVPRLGLFEDVSGRYRRQVDTGAPEQSLEQPAEKRPRALHFTVLQERSPYEPLVENDSQHKLKEEKKAKKKEKYKKYRKNVGKALRYSWKCLMLGLQNFTVGYSTPLSAAATIVPDFHPGGAWG